jgi:ribosomal protein S18 acetylase RimI-like enzyme
MEIEWSNVDALINDPVRKEMLELLELCFELSKSDADEDDPLTIDNFLLRIIGFCDPNICEFILLKIDSRLVGTACIAEFTNTLFVSNLCVHPQFQNRGLGTLLLAYSAGRAIEKGKKTISGSVQISNEKLVSYYASKGAKPIQIGYSNRPSPQALPTRFQRDITEEEVNNFLQQAERSVLFRDNFDTSSKWIVRAWLTAVMTILFLHSFQIPKAL